MRTIRVEQFQLKNLTLHRRTFFGGAEEGYEKQTERIFHYTCLVCKTKHSFTTVRHEDAPGFRYPSDMVKIKFPCGHEAGLYDQEHREIFFK